MNHFETAKGHFLEGLRLFERQDYVAAEATFRRALALMPDRVSILCNLSGTLIKLGKFSEAKAMAIKAVSIDGSAVDGLLNLGICQSESGQLNEALVSFDEAIKHEPGHAGAFYNRGLTLHELKRFDEALASYDEAIKLNPNNADAYNNRGNTLQELKRLDEALASYDEAITREPSHPEPYNNRGNTLRDLARLDLALVSYDEAIKRKPDYASAYRNRGITLHKLHRLEDALASYDEALRHRPVDADTYNDRGNTLQSLKRLDKALADYDEAIKLKPEFAGAYYNRGNTLQELKRLDEALASYGHAEKIKPDYDYWYGTWLHTKMRLCDWNEADDQVAELVRKIECGINATPSFPVLALIDSPALQRKAAEIWVNDKYPTSHALPAIAKRSRHKRIRIGYYSADFQNHATAYLIAELFERHDRRKFELVAFSFSPDTTDDMHRRVCAAFDQFVDIRNEADRDVALLSRNMEIDIAVDLKGYTRDARVGIFACRAAPLQASYLGYPGTTGADYFDYLIADNTLIPDSNRQHYSEKIAYLPHSYQVNDRGRTIATKTFSREELGLPRTDFVFCCFNNSYKITPASFDGWMRLLKQVDGSVLWLLRDNPTAVRNLRREAAARDVNAERLVFADRMPVADHLARHRAADLFVDTFPCNAHTTASDALWAGLPVLTLMGESFASRVAASLLKAIGLPELIATSQEQYEALAVELATNSERLGRIRRKLERNRLTTPLFDTGMFTNHIEAAYAQMYERYQADLPPDHIYVTEHVAKS